MRATNSTRAKKEVLNFCLLELGLIIDAHSFLNQPCFLRHQLGLIKVNIKIVRVSSLTTLACLAIFTIVLDLEFSLLSVKDISEDIGFKLESQIDHAINGTVSVAVTENDRVDLAYTIDTIFCLDHDTWGPILFSKHLG